MHKCGKLGICRCLIESGNRALLIRLLKLSSYDVIIVMSVKWTLTAECVCVASEHRE